MNTKNIKFKLKKLRFEFVLRNYYFETDKFRRRIYIKNECGEFVVCEDDNTIYTKKEITMIIELLDKIIHDNLKEIEKRLFLSNDLNIVYCKDKSVVLNKNNKKLIEFNSKDIQYLYNYLCLIVFNNNAVSKKEFATMKKEGILLMEEGYNTEKLKEYIQQINNQYLFKIISPFNLFKTITLSKSTYQKEYSCFNGFICTVKDSLQTNFIISANRLLNKNEDNNIHDLLEKCEENYYSFPKEKCDDIKKEIEELREYLDSKEQLIKNISRLRNKVLVHFDSKYFYNPEAAFEKYSFSCDNFEELMNKIHNFLNNISLNLFGSITGYFVNQNPCEEFKNIFNKLKNK